MFYVGFTTSQRTQPPPICPPVLFDESLQQQAELDTSHDLVCARCFDHVLERVCLSDTVLDRGPKKWSLSQRFCSRGMRSIGRASQEKGSGTQAQVGEGARDVVSEGAQCCLIPSTDCPQVWPQTQTQCLLGQYSLAVAGMVWEQPPG